MSDSTYAFAHGVRATRLALAEWQRRPALVLRAWLFGSIAAAALLLVAVWVVAIVAAPASGSLPHQPPFFAGHPLDVDRIVAHNVLVLALHAMACVAGFIAGSSLPLQARSLSGVNRWVHERGRPIAMAFVVVATTFSLSLQAYTIGTALGHVSAVLHAPAALVLLGLLPHAVPELAALFLPLAAWVIASRRGEWDKLLAATVVTVAIALPVLIVSGVWEVYVAPHVLSALLGYR